MNRRRIIGPGIFASVGRWLAAVQALPSALMALNTLASDKPIAEQILTLAQWAARHPRRPMPIERAAQAAVDAARLLGRRERACLPVSFTLFALLTAMQQRPSIVTGVKRSQGQLSGHAWVEIGGISVTPPGIPADNAGFRLLYRYPA